MKNHYSSLGLNSDGLKEGKPYTPEEIKKAHRAKVLKCHPDKGGSAALVQEVIEAYKVLSDTKKREEYDEFLRKNPSEKDVSYLYFDDVIDSSKYSEDAASSRTSATSEVIVRSENYLSKGAINVTWLIESAKYNPRYILGLAFENENFANTVLSHMHQLGLTRADQFELFLIVESRIGRSSKALSELGMKNKESLLKLLVETGKKHFKDFQIACLRRPQEANFFLERNTDILEKLSFEQLEKLGEKFTIASRILEKLYSELAEEKKSANDKKLALIKEYKEIVLKYATSGKSRVIPNDTSRFFEDCSPIEFFRMPEEKPPSSLDKDDLLKVEFICIFVNYMTFSHEKLEAHRKNVFEDLRLDHMKILFNKLVKYINSINKDQKLWHIFDYVESWGHFFSRLELTRIGSEAFRIFLCSISFRCYSKTHEKEIELLVKKYRNIALSSLNIGHLISLVENKFALPEWLFEGVHYCNAFGIQIDTEDSSKDKGFLFSFIFNESCIQYASNVSNEQFRKRLIRLILIFKIKKSDLPQYILDFNLYDVFETLFQYTKWSLFPRIFNKISEKNFIELFKQTGFFPNLLCLDTDNLNIKEMILYGAKDYFEECIQHYKGSFLSLFYQLSIQSSEKVGQLLLSYPTLVTHLVPDKFYENEGRSVVSDVSDMVYFDIFEENSYWRDYVTGLLLNTWFDYASTETGLRQIILNSETNFNKELKSLQQEIKTSPQDKIKRSRFVDEFKANAQAATRKTPMHGYFALKNSSHYQKKREAYKALLDYLEQYPANSDEALLKIFGLLTQSGLDKKTLKIVSDRLAGWGSNLLEALKGLILCRCEFKDQKLLKEHFKISTMDVYAQAKKFYVVANAYIDKKGADIPGDELCELYAIHGEKISEMINKHKLIHQLSNATKLRDIFLLLKEGKTLSKVTAVELNENNRLLKKLHDLIEEGLGHETSSSAHDKNDIVLFHSQLSKLPKETIDNRSLEIILRHSFDPTATFENIIKAWLFDLFLSTGEYFYTQKIHQLFEKTLPGFSSKLDELFDYLVKVKKSCYSLAELQEKFGQEIADEILRRYLNSKLPKKEISLTEFAHLKKLLEKKKISLSELSRILPEQLEMIFQLGFYFSSDRYTKDLLMMDRNFFPAMPKNLANSLMISMNLIENAKSDMMDAGYSSYYVGMIQESFENGNAVIKNKIEEFNNVLDRYKSLLSLSIFELVDYELDKANLSHEDANLVKCSKDELRSVFVGLILAETQQSSHNAATSNALKERVHAEIKLFFSKLNELGVLSPFKLINHFTRQFLQVVNTSALQEVMTPVGNGKEEQLIKELNTALPLLATVGKDWTVFYEKRGAKKLVLKGFEALRIPMTHALGLNFLESHIMSKNGVKYVFINKCPELCYRINKVGEIAALFPQEKSSFFYYGRTEKELELLEIIPLSEIDSRGLTALLPSFSQAHFLFLCEKGIDNFFSVCLKDIDFTQEPLATIFNRVNLDKVTFSNVKLNAEQWTALQERGRTDFKGAVLKKDELITAMKAGENKKVLQLLNRGADGAKYHFGYSVLYLAIKGNLSLEVLNKILDAPNLDNKALEQSVELIINNNLSQYVPILLKILENPKYTYQQNDSSATKNLGSKALHLFITNKSSRGIFSLYQKGFNVFEESSKNYSTASIDLLVNLVSSDIKHLDMVETLFLNFKEVVNITQKAKNTLLGYATQANNSNLARCLLENDALFENDCPYCFRHENAISNAKDYEMASVLLPYFDPFGRGKNERLRDILIKALDRLNVPLAWALLEMNVTDGSCRAPQEIKSDLLEQAFLKCKQEAILFLLEHGMNPNTVLKSKGNSILGEAVFNDLDDVVNYLIRPESGIDHHSLQQGVLHLVDKFRMTEQCQKQLEAMVKNSNFRLPNYQFVDRGHDALHTAVTREHKEAVESLLHQGGFDILRVSVPSPASVAKYPSRTSLETALDQDLKDIVKIMLKNSSQDTKDKALKMAIDKKRKKSDINFLRQCGAKDSATNKTQGDVTTDSSQSIEKFLLIASIKDLNNENVDSVYSLVEEKLQSFCKDMNEADKELIVKLIDTSFNYLRIAYTSHSKIYTASGIESTKMFISRVLSNKTDLTQESFNYIEGEGHYKKYRKSSTYQNSRRSLFNATFFHPVSEVKSLAHLTMSHEEMALLQEINTYSKKLPYTPENINFRQFTQSLLSIYSDYKGSSKRRRETMKAITLLVKDVYKQAAESRNVVSSLDRARVETAKIIREIPCGFWGRSRLKGLLHKAVEDSIKCTNVKP